MFIKVENRRVRHIWRCNADDCTHADRDNLRVFHDTTINPTFYEHSGTPVCECGCDMKYVRTEVDIENCLIP